MKKLSVLFFVVIPAAAFLLFSLIKWWENREDQLPYFGTDNSGNYFSSHSKDNLNPVNGFTFINQQGKVTDSTFVQNKIWVADYFFVTCGTICPEMSTNMKMVQDEFKGENNVRILSFTCNPDKDQPEQLQAYADEYGADESIWHFLTGDKKQLYRFARKSLRIVATEGAGDEGDFIHSQNFVLIDKEGYIRGYYDGTDREHVKQLITDIRKLLR
jgi:protein SCO1